MPEVFQPEKRLMRRAFERAADSYDAAAVLQREVCDRMAERLDYIKHQPHRVLDAGSGTGYGSGLLRTTYPKAQVLELDIAHSMLLAARRKQGLLKRWLAPAPALCADIERLPLQADSVDMIWSNLAIQWVTDLDQAFAEFHRVLRPEGLLMFSTLGPDTLRELRQAFAGLDGHTHVNRFIDMHDIGDGLVRNGFATPVMDMEYLTLTYDDVRAVMQDLKAIGAHNVTHGRPQGLMGKQRWQQVLRNYEQLRQDGKLPATYEVVYGHAWKPQPRPARQLPDGRQVIDFHPRGSRG
ncbi:malonyl-ACP O-methyltransferase BioC [Leeia aquatica]|uniref:Malonyl-[acyl-carrier protein] O-methyltransferase n=1 Tax=Leeia aquatica TaxID=2725557 RepID=A0A847SBT0_9NEIS|nr:malonyl-ACP O-methyltransferase BioC [Leeia aquatica]NLR74976.1 malonyl-ACP O-methyltransferase BioC [Leeia aquatica]